MATRAPWPAETREAYLTHLAALRDSNLNLVEQLYNIDLRWQTALGGDEAPVGGFGDPPDPAPVGGFGGPSPDPAHVGGFGDFII